MKPLAVTLVLAALSIACDRHQEQALSVTSPLESASLRSHTGVSGIGWHQELMIRLQPGVPLSRAVDMAVFGPLQPGVTAKEARQLAGSPVSTRTDELGTTVEVFKSSAGMAEVGCREPEDSVGGPRGACTWVLYARPSASAAEQLFTPPVVSVVRAAQQLRPDARSLQVYVCTHGTDWECVLCPLVADWEKRLEWYRKSAA
jgi:hypothetical protein